MIKFLAAAKYQSCLYLITNLFIYDSTNDIYIPKYGGVEGKVMRHFIDAISGTSLARQDTSDTEYLVSAE